MHSSILKALDREIGDYFASHPRVIGGQYKPDSAEIVLYALGHDDVPLLAWGVKIGDCLHNLRSALVWNHCWNRAIGTRRN